MSEIDKFIEELDQAFKSWESNEGKKHDPISNDDYYLGLIKKTKQEARIKVTELWGDNCE